MGSYQQCEGDADTARAVITAVVWTLIYIIETVVRYLAVESTPEINNLVV